MKTFISGPTADSAASIIIPYCRLVHTK